MTATMTERGNSRLIDTEGADPEKIRVFVLKWRIIRWRYANENLAGYLLKYDNMMGRHGGW